MLLAPRPLPRLRRGRDLLGARRHGADALPDRRGRGARVGAARSSARRSTSTSSTRRSARFVEPRLAHLLGLERARARATGRTCSPPGGCSSSGSPTTYPTVLVFEDMQWADAEPARLRRVPARLVAQPPAVRRHARPPGAARAPPDLGRRPAQLHLAATSSRSPPEAMEELLDGLVPGPARGAARADPRARRGRPAVRRRDGADAARPRAARPGGPVYRPDRRRSRRSRSPRRCTR